MPSKNYKKILTELFRKYNPAKISEVDELLDKFKGREEELVRKIKLKYARKVPVSSSRKLWQRKPLLLLAILLALGGLGLGGWYAADRGWISGWGEKSDPEQEVDAMDSIPYDYDETQESQGDDSMDQSYRQAPFSAPPMEYGVQVGLFSDPDNSKIKKRLGDRQMELNVLPADNDLYMYVVGNDLELDAARSRRDELRANGFPDAFVVGLRKGKRVEVRPGE